MSTLPLDGFSLPLSTLSNVDFPEPLAVGDRISLLNAGGYTMVKKNWFNGVAMPAIAIRRKTGAIDLVQSFDYADYVASLS